MADYQRRPRHLSRHHRSIIHDVDSTVRPVAPDSPPQRPSQPQPENQSSRPSGESHNGGDDEFQDQKEALLERLHSFHAPYEDLDLFTNPFDSDSSRHLSATFQDGRRLAEVRNDPAIIRPRVGITFLAGADTPQVNQMEEFSMTQAEPDQKFPAWRVATAGSLLTNSNFRKDMTIEFTNITPNIVQTYRDRHSSDGQFVNPNIPSRAMTTRRKPDRLLNIDSDNVKIVRDLSQEKWDLEAVLIEVDQSSLLALISNYQGLIRHCGPDLPLTETIQLLDTMIEDARRLCIRSPNLFRMSTRRLIVASKNTRYGVDDSTKFKTLITSSGIKYILSLSAAYFNSLPQSVLPGSQQQERIQSEVRPRFLQMVVLLLALLNDDDLAQLKEFLEVTYGIRADRQHLELLILKVLPLSSINSKIFLHSLVTAVGGQMAKPSPHLADQAIVWKLFVESLLAEGYILPGNIHEVGGSEHSWVVNWPEHGGFKDTSVFRHLQYVGTSRTINEIPRVDLNSEVTLGAELTVKLANGGEYIVASPDLENIVRMTPGRYSVTEAVHGGRSFDLDISDTWVNQPLFQAISDVNNMLGLVKSIMPQKSQAMVRFRRVFGGQRYDDSTLAEIRGCGRLTYHCARLNGQYFAVTYKIDGRAIGRRELIRLFQADQNKIDSMVRAVNASLTTLYDGKRTSSQVSQTLFRLQEEVGQIQTHVVEADRRKQTMLGFPTTLMSEPVAKVLYQVGSRDTQVNVWRNYKAWHQANENVLYIDSERRVVHDCAWQDDDTLVVTFHDVPHMRYFATPLSPGPVPQEVKHEQLKPGDAVLLCGHYMLIVEPTREVYAAPNGGGGGSGGGGGVKLSFSQREQHQHQHQQPQRELRIPPALRPRRPEQELHLHDGLPELEARERAAQSMGYENAHGRGDGIRRRPAPGVPQPAQDIRQLEMVVNWLKVTGVEQAGLARVRGALRERGPGVVRSFIR